MTALLTMDEVAARLHKSRRWLQDHIEEARRAALLPTPRVRKI